MILLENKGDINNATHSFMVCDDLYKKLCSIFCLNVIGECYEEFNIPSFKYEASVTEM